LEQKGGRAYQIGESPTGQTLRETAPREAGEKPPLSIDAYFGRIVPGQLLIPPGLLPGNAEFPHSGLQKEIVNDPAAKMLHDATVGHRQGHARFLEDTHTEIQLTYNQVWLRPDVDWRKNYLNGSREISSERMAQANARI